MAKIIHKPNPELKNFDVTIEALGKVSTKVGWFESAKYPDGTPVAYVATIQEFGYPAGRIPPRPFFRLTIATEVPAWRELIAKAARGVVRGKRTPYQAMELLGLQAAGDVRKTISKIVTPPLSLLTLQARKYRKEGGKVTGKTLGELNRQRDAGPPDISGVSTKPLVDTRVMLPTLTHITEQKQ